MTRHFQSDLHHKTTSMTSFNRHKVAQMEQFCVRNRGLCETRPSEGGKAPDAGEGQSWGRGLNAEIANLRPQKGFIFLLKYTIVNDFDDLIRLKWRHSLAERRRTVIKSRIEETEMRRFHKTALFSKTWNLVSTDVRPNLDELSRAVLSADQFNLDSWTHRGTKLL